MKATKSDQTRPTALGLYIDSYREDTFDPESDALDFLTCEVLADAFRKDLKPPFSLQFFDADQVLVGERCVKFRKTSVIDKTVSRRCGIARVPLICKLVDALGRTHERTLSEEETRKWVIAPSFCGSYVDGAVYHVTSLRPSDSPNFSLEVYLALWSMLCVSRPRELEPPFTVEIRDAQGRLFQAAEIYVDEEGKLRTRTDIVDCAHLPFPVTVKLISQSGAELMETVQRRH